MAPRRRKGRVNPKKTTKPPKTIQIIVKNLSGQVCELEVVAEMTVYKLKEKLTGTLFPPTPRPFLIFEHVKLEDSRRLSFYNIRNGSELFSVRDFETMVRRGDITDNEIPRNNPDRRVARHFLRRVCDNCGRQGTFKEPRFAVCYCGARRYCDERCQAADWRSGHSRRCAAGHTFPEDVMDCLDFLKFDLEEGTCTADEFERALGEIFEQYPPPADRER